MLSSIVMELARTSGRGAVSGRHAHAWLLDAVGGIDAVTSGNLHGPRERRKPFTVWVGPRFVLDSGGGIVVDSSDARWWLRATALDATMSAILARLAEDPPRAIRLGTHAFDVIGVSASVDTNSWSGAVTYDELVEHWRATRGGDRVTLRFLSPTTFSSADMEARFPSADLVFTSLVRRWNDRSRHAFADDLVLRAPTSLRVSAYRVHTVSPVDFGKHWIRGFVGVCEYAIAQDTPADVRRCIHLMADFAFFAGVGLKTTMGMGQVICESHG